jgi:hypothetical protein
MVVQDFMMAVVGVVVFCNVRPVRNHPNFKLCILLVAIVDTKDPTSTTQRHQ